MEFDETQDECFKIFSEEAFTIPLNLCMRKRMSNHPLNVTHRCNTGHGRISSKEPAICFNQQLLGVIGSVKSKNPKDNTVKIIINKDEEESKIHNPFLAENFLRRELVSDGKIDNKGKVKK